MRKRWTDLLSKPFERGMIGRMKRLWLCKKRKRRN